MIEKSEAIILKRSDYGETSLIVTFYTKKLGKLTGILKGVRSDDKKYRSSFENFSLNHIVFYCKSTNSLNLVTECELIDSFQEVRKDLEKIRLATYFINLIDKSTQLNYANSDIFDLCMCSLKFLEEYQNLDKLVRIFEIKLLVANGLMPHINSCSYCGKYINPVRDTKVSERKIKVSNGVNENNFSYKFGGLLCENCTKYDTNYFRMLKGALCSMRFIMESDLKTAVRIELTNEVKQQLETLLLNFLSYHLDINPEVLYQRTDDKKYLSVVR